MKFLLSKSLKKIQAFLLVTAMVISSFSSAITAKADEPKGQKQSESSYLNPNGGVVNAAGTFSKKVLSVDQANGTAEIELKVSGKNTTTAGENIYIALVIDKSNSMSDNGRERQLEKAVNNIITDLKNNKNADKINLGIVEFGTNASYKENMKKVKDYNFTYDLIIPGNNAGGTNTSDGILKATNMLKSAGKGKKAMVILTDGVPTYGKK